MSIEELAFKDRKILANLNAVDLLNIIEFLQDDRRQRLEELSKTHNRSVEIQKENQELKSQLAGTTHCFDEEEHRKLKDEIKKLERIIELCHLDAKETLATINYEQELQKKEFINYLQKEINQHTAHIDAINSYGISIYSPDYDNSKLKLAIFKEVLLKYIETIQTKIDKSV